MAFDCHIHLRDAEKNREGLRPDMQRAGVEGGIIFSLPPPSMATVAPTDNAEARVENVLSWCRDAETLYPFFWIDPTAGDAVAQVAMAVEKGVAGFKIICNQYYPGDARAMKAYDAIAKAGRPILFHSGILWDGRPSSPYNRPAGFEALLEITGLKFALAHISWPWCDECIAVYGKFLNSYTRRNEVSVEMFIDTTPGTPVIYREEALTKLFTVGYDVANNVMFGSDAAANGYNSKWVSEWIERDRGILQKIGVEKETIDKVFSGNMKRFLGLNSESVERKLPRAGE